jgi:hypothetical protein
MDFWKLACRDGKVEVVSGYMSETPGAGQGFYIASDKHVIWHGSITDPVTGKHIASVPAYSILAGNILIGMGPLAAERLVGRTRPDRMALMQYSVYDLSDPLKPKKISDGNILGGPETPADISDTYFPEFAKPENKRFSLGCYKGIGGAFDGAICLTAHGSRILVKSNTHLYCLGER